MENIRWVFAGNLILFLTVQKVWNFVHIWQSCHRFCNVPFLMDHSVYYWA